MRALLSGLVLLALILVAPDAPAQLPAPKLNWIFPAGASLGATQEVSVAGTDLDEPSGLLFSDARITSHPRGDGSPVFRVVVPADVAPGLVDVRVVGRFGVSNPRGFVLGTERDLVAPTTHLLATSAFDVPLDTAVHGRVQPATASWFRFEARRGQRLLVGVQARELDSRLVPDLLVQRESDRREMRVVRRGQVLDFTAPDDGRYLLQLHDQTFKGGDDYLFRLTVSTRPRVEFALPFALGPEFPTRITLFGRNLPGGTSSPVSAADGRELEALDLEVAAAEPLGPFLPLPLAPWIGRKPAAANGAAEHWVVTPRLGESPMPPLLFARTAWPSTWSVSNGVARVTPPCEFAGAFPRRGEASGVVFEGRKDSVHWIEIFSDRLGFNSDAHLVVQRIRRDKDGKETVQDLAEFADLETNLGGRDFDTTSRDAAGRWQVPEDGTFRVLARDLLRGTASSPRLPYRLQIRPETPDFRLAFYPQPPPRRDDNDRQVHLWTPTLRRGGTLPIRVVAFRRDGFDGPIEIRVGDLPQGVTAAPARIASGQSSTALLLAAATDAPAGHGFVRMTGHSRVRDQDIVRNAVAASGRWHIPDWDQERGSPRFAEDLVFGVVATEQTPVALNPAAAPIEIVSKSKLRIPVDIVRRDAFPGAFKIKPFGHPALDKAKETDVPEKATNVVVEIDLAEVPLPEGETFVHLEATVSGKYRNNPEAAEAAEAAAKTSATEAAEAADQSKKADEALAEARKLEAAAMATLQTAEGRVATGTDPAAATNRVAAEKAFEEARLARAAAETRLAETQARAKSAEDRKNAAAARSKAASEKAQPRDVSFRAYSLPVVIRVSAPPKAG